MHILMQKDSTTQLWLCNNENGIFGRYNLLTILQTDTPSLKDKTSRDGLWADGLKSCKYTWKITIFMKMWKLGQYRENLIFFNNC